MINLIMGLLVIKATFIKSRSVPSVADNDTIMESLKYRSNTFLTTDRAVSKWGQDA